MDAQIAVRELIEELNAYARFMENHHMDLVLRTDYSEQETTPIDLLVEDVLNAEEVLQLLKDQLPEAYPEFKEVYEEHKSWSEK